MNTVATPHYLTLGQAAKACNISKGYLSKAIKSGKISVVSKDSSGYQIDPSELFRVFPPVKQETIDSEQLETSKYTQETPSKWIELQVRLELANEQLDYKEKLIEEVKKQRDSWQQQAERLLLTYQPSWEGEVKKSLPEPSQKPAQERNENSATLPSNITNNALKTNIWLFIAIFLIAMVILGLLYYFTR